MRILFIISTLFLLSCSKENLQDGMKVKGTFYPIGKVIASSTTCLNQRLYAIYGKEGRYMNVSLNFSCDTLKSGSTYMVYINKNGQNGWELDSAQMVSVVYEKGLLSARWKAGYVRNVFVSEQ